MPGNLTLPTTEIRNGSQKLTKLLLNVNIERSLGPVQVIMAPDNMVKDLIKAAIEIYAREKRRPLLKETNPDGFQLHYSQFSLESKCQSYFFIVLYRRIEREVSQFKEKSNPILKY